LELVEWILQFYHSDWTNDISWSPLHWAARVGDSKILEILQNAGLPEYTVDTLEPAGTWSPLSIAVYHQKVVLAANTLQACDDTTDQHGRSHIKTQQLKPQMFLSAVPAETVSVLAGQKHSGYLCNYCFHVSAGAIYPCTITCRKSRHDFKRNYTFKRGNSLAHLFS
jgi:ankyrin repeat protein